MLHSLLQLLVLVTSDARAFSPGPAFLPLALALSPVQHLLPCASYAHFVSSEQGDWTRQEIEAVLESGQNVGLACAALQLLYVLSRS